MAFDRVNARLSRAIQDLRGRADDHRAKITANEEVNADLKRQVREIEAEIAEISQTLTTQGGTVPAVGL